MITPAETNLFQTGNDILRNSDSSRGTNGSNRLIKVYVDPLKRLIFSLRLVCSAIDTNTCLATSIASEAVLVSGAFVLLSLQTCRTI